MEGGAADRNHSEEGQGGTHTTGNHRGEGGYHGVGGGGGAALHHIYGQASGVPSPPPPTRTMVWSAAGWSWRPAVDLPTGGIEE